MHLFEVNLPKHKSLLFALKSIYGLKNLTKTILKKLGYCKNLQVKNLSSNQISKLVLFINLTEIVLSNDLKKINAALFKKLINLKLVRGLRLLKGLPVRGQRTHTNRKTSKKKLFLYISNV